DYSDLLLTAQRTISPQDGSLPYICMPRRKTRPATRRIQYTVANSNSNDNSGCHQGTVTIAIFTGIAANDVNGTKLSSVMPQPAGLSITIKVNTIGNQVIIITALLPLLFGSSIEAAIAPIKLAHSTTPSKANGISHSTTPILIQLKSTAFCANRLTTAKAS